MSAVTSEEVAKGPPATATPLEVKYSPSNELVTFLYPDENGLFQIHAVNLNDENPQVSLFCDIKKLPVASSELSFQEQLRRERMRNFSRGVTRYQWDTSKTTTGQQQLIIPINGQVLRYSEESKALEIVYDGTLPDNREADAVDPKLSPDGKKIAFVADDDLYVLYLPSSDAAPRVVRLTREGERTGVSCGLADYLAQEEMDRYEGFWWSPNSDYIAFTIVDETVIPEFIITHPGDEDPHRKEIHRYPFAGKTNPKVDLAVISVPPDADAEVRGFEVIDLTLESTTRASWKDDSYIGRVGWWPDNSISVQVENRDQNNLHVLKIDPKTLLSVTLIEEKESSWINLHNLLTPLKSPSPSESFEFIWASERSGYRQLYLYSWKSGDGGIKGKLIGEGGSWVVDSIAGVDENNGFIYVNGNRDHPTEKQLYRLSYRTSASTLRITEEAGWHTSFVNATGGAVVVLDVFSKLDSPSVTRLISLDSSRPALIVPLLSSRDYNSKRNESLIPSLIVPTIESIRSSDGEADLFYSLRYPRGYIPGVAPPLAAVLSVYGGPHVQYVTNQWTSTASLREARLAEEGYLVIRVDNRGSDRRGLKFESSIHLNMGEVEVIDYVTVVKHLVGRGLVDPARVGIMGWSYGGYITLMSLARAPEVFACGVSGAPVTSWDGYDTHYTERYMGRPEVNSHGYYQSSVMTHVSNIQGKLLLIHGLIDENVHFRHTSRLITSLIKARKAYDLLLFPSERHSPLKLDDRAFMEDQILIFLQKHLPLTWTTSGESAAAASEAVEARSAAVKAHL